MLELYEKFALKNAQLISNIEHLLKTLIYALPGRFEDSILLSEICTAHSLIASTWNLEMYPLVSRLSLLQALFSCREF